MVGSADAGATVTATGVDAALPVRRRMGGPERLMYLAEQTYGGTFRIATVLTLCSPNPLTAARLTAAIDAVAARHDALRTVVIGQEFVVAPPTATPTVDVKAVAEDAEGVTAAAFADAQSVLAAGTSGAWTNPPLPAGAAAHTPISLPWRAGVYLPAPGSTHAPTDAAAVVYYLPHYLSDGTSVDVLAAATIDALTAASSAGVVAAGQVGMAAAGEVVPLAPAVNDVYPPQGGGLLGMAAGLLRFASEVAAPVTRRHRRALVFPPGPPATPATRTASAIDAVVSAAALRRFAAAARAAGTTVGCGLVAALAVALDGVGVMAPSGSDIAVDVPINGRVGAPAGSGLTPTTVGCYVGAGIVDVPLAGGAYRDGGGDPPDLWALASKVHAAVHAPGYRASELSAFGVLSAILTCGPGRALVRSVINSTTEQGRIMPPTVSNVGRCGLSDAANGRAVAAAAAAPAGAAGGDGANGGFPTVGAIRLMDWEAQMGAPLILYACSVAGAMTLVLTSTQPQVPTATAGAMLASVVKTIEAA
ncbi:hypothetical protein I4F81_002047 [Pyropia yezoensis]|uniref:Uncharacterized protein n=1 Tax=Pyropia yezoensis TaxID=2788 RepID=A0ACC3BNX8_PYRYE|nr:hypothetical protein I4F81_002047 [Neopyropia yezoensis]